MPAQRPLLVSLCSSTSWLSLVVWEVALLSGDGPQRLLASSKVENSFRDNQAFLWIHGTAKVGLQLWVPVYSWIIIYYYILFHLNNCKPTSTVNPPFGPLLVCRFISLHHFPHPELRTLTKNCYGQLLSLEEEAWPGLWIHTDLDLNCSPSAYSSASYLTM